MIFLVLVKSCPANEPSYALFLLFPLLTPRSNGSHFSVKKWQQQKNFKNTHLNSLIGDNRRGGEYTVQHCNRWQEASGLIVLFAHLVLHCGYENPCSFCLWGRSGFGTGSEIRVKFRHLQLNRWIFFLRGYSLHWSLTIFKKRLGSYRYFNEIVIPWGPSDLASRSEFRSKAAIRTLKLGKAIFCLQN